MEWRQHSEAQQKVTNPGGRTEQRQREESAKVAQENIYGSVKSDY